MSSQKFFKRCSQNIPKPPVQNYSGAWPPNDFKSSQKPEINERALSLQNQYSKNRSAISYTNTKIPNASNSKQQHNTNQINTIAQQKHKTNHTLINCLNLGTMVKSKTGLSTHLRFNKNCQKGSAEMVKHFWQNLKLSQKII